MDHIKSLTHTKLWNYKALNVFKRKRKEKTLLGNFSFFFSDLSMDDIYINFKHTKKWKEKTRFYESRVDLKVKVFSSWKKQSNKKLNMRTKRESMEERKIAVSQEIIGISSVFLPRHFERKSEQCKTKIRNPTNNTAKNPTLLCTWVKILCDNMFNV